MDFFRDDVVFSTFFSFRVGTPRVDKLCVLEQCDGFFWGWQSKCCSDTGYSTAGRGSVDGGNVFAFFRIFRLFTMPAKRGDVNDFQFPPLSQTKENSGSISEHLVNYWLIACFIHSNDWLIDWLIDRLIDWLARIRNQKIHLLLYPLEFLVTLTNGWLHFASVQHLVIAPQFAASLLATSSPNLTGRKTFLTWCKLQTRFFDYFHKRYRKQKLPLLSFLNSSSFLSSKELQKQ